MQNQPQPNPRFNQYTQIIKKGKVIGFKLDNNNFEFLFDSNGGWYDEQGRYYNSQAIQCSPPEEQQSQSQQQNEQSLQKDNINKLNEQLVEKIQLKEDKRLELIKDYHQMIDNYPEGKDIFIFFTLQPQIKNGDEVVNEFIKKQLKQTINIQQGEFKNILDHELAKKLVQLQGSRISNSTLYLDMWLYHSLQIVVKMRKNQLIEKLTQLNYQKNKDYGNIEQTEYEKGKYECLFDIDRDIENHLRQVIQFQINDQ